MSVVTKLVIRIIDPKEKNLLEYELYGNCLYKFLNYLIDNHIRSPFRLINSLTEKENRIIDIELLGLNEYPKKSNPPSEIISTFEKIITDNEYLLMILGAYIQSQTMITDRVQNQLIKKVKETINPKYFENFSHKQFETKQLNQLVNSHYYDFIDSKRLMSEIINICKYAAVMNHKIKINWVQYQ